MEVNKKIARLPESETLRLNALANKLAAAGKKIFNLTAGELDFETPSVVRREVLRHLSENKYTPVLGFESLRRVVAQRVKKLYKIQSASAGNIAITAGAKQALAEALQVILNPKDEVIIPVPAWSSYEQQVKLAAGRPVFVALKPDFDLDIKAVKAALTPKTRAIILNSPHNPTGRIFSDSALKQVAKFLSGREVYAIADTVYQSLAYARQAPNLPRYFKKNLILIDSFSKSHALTGWRLGYIAAAPNIIDALGRLQGHISGNASVLSQAAAFAAATAPQITAGFVRILKKRRQLAAEGLAKIPGIRFRLPDAGFYFFLDISEATRDSGRFCEQLLKTTGVALVPGEAFRAPGFARLSFAAGEKDLREGVRRLAKFVKLYPA